MYERMCGISFLLFALSACKKVPILDEQLPPVTQSGQNVFACIINDERVYRVDGRYETSQGFPLFCKTGTNLYSWSYGTGGGPYFEARQCLERGWEEIKVAIRDSVRLGTYIIPTGSNGIVAGIDYEQRLPDDVPGPFQILYDSRGPAQSGFIQVLRFDDSVFAGTFEVELTNYDSLHAKRKMKLSKGRFDFRLP